MSQNSIEQQYIAYFGRAADPAGLNYWLSQEAMGQPDTTIAMNFAPQLETLGIYPGLSTPALLSSNPALQSTFINAVYQNLFGHAPDTAGLSYWQGQLTAGANPGFMVTQIIFGALGTDMIAIQNRATVAAAYTNAVASAQPPVTWNPNLDTPQSKAIIGTVTSSSATVTAATPQIASAIANDQSGSTGVPGNTLLLTGGPDTFSLNGAPGFQTSNNNDTIRGIKGALAPGTAGASELTSFDTISDGKGANVMNAVLSNEAVVTPALQNVKTLNLSPGNAAQTFSGATTTGTTLINLAGGQFGATGGDNAAWTLTVAGVSTAVSLGMSNATGFVENLIGTFTGLAVSGNSATLVLSGSAGGTFDTTLVAGNGVNTYNIQSTGKANTVSIGAADTQLTTENITGSAGLTLSNGNTGVTTINGSSATGPLSIFTGAVTNNITVIGGSGSNTINASAATKIATLNGGSGGKNTLIFNGTVAANNLTGGGGGAGDTIQTTAGGMTFLSAGDATSATTLATDVDVVTDYSAGGTTIDIKGGGTINTLSGTQLTAVAASTSILTAAQLAAANTASKGLVAFGFGGDEYILQTNKAAGAFAATDGLMKLTGAAATFRNTDLVNT